MLRQLELFGFKSFADRTAFEFVPGVTCVVGPNGSGKSNVVDAIKWILGDQSAKSLRGKEMSDVIFNGSAGRKPSGYAEATLTFDNTSRLLRADVDEVRVGRRLYRSGESEYLLNGAVVRLKDIRDLFLGTGAGTSAYSIIEQGRVDQILQANPTTRRIVFEEAAGISRYKNRRVDSERRLERVEQNLARLRDIVKEVESQLAAMRSQATKAARYREIAGELKELWTGLAADEYRRLSAEENELVSALAARQERLHELQTRSGELEAAQQELETTLGGLDERLQQLVRERSAQRELIAARESTVRYQTGRQRELEADLADLRRERQHLALRARGVVDELRETAAQLAEFERQLAAQQQDLEARRREVRELQSQSSQAQQVLAERQQRREEWLRKADEHQNRASVIGAQKADLQDALEAAEARIEELQQAVARAAADKQASQDEADRAAADHERARTAAERLHQERMRLLDEQNQGENSLAAMREQRITWDARIHILEGLELRQEGLSLGVRKILERARSIPSPPWNQIVACVGDLLEVPLERAALLEVALGARAQLIVTRNLGSLVEYLNSDTSSFEGRVGFIEITTDGVRGPGLESLQHAGHQLPDLTDHPGVVARADTLATEAEHVRGLAALLLADTWIVETLLVARRLRERYPACRFVTLQGELLDSDGALYAGLTPHETSFVSRRSELRRLRADLRRLDEDIADHLRELAVLGRNLTAVDGDLARADEERTATARRLDEARVDLAARQREHSKLDAECRRARSAADELAERIAALNAELQWEMQQAAECRQEAERLHESAVTLQAEIRQAEELLSQAHEEIARQQLELTTHRERARALRDVQTRLERDQAQRQQQLQSVEERLRSLLSARREIQLAILNAGAEIAGLVLSAEALDASLAEVQSERAALRARRAALSRELDRVHGERRALADEVHHTELQLREIRHQKASWELRIEEEYQLKLTDLAAAGVSAIERYRCGDPPLESDRADASAGVAHEDSGISDEGPPATDSVAGRSDDELRREIEEQVQRLRRKLKALGHVNTESLASLDELETRYARLSTQLNDLEEAKTALEEIIRRINGESRRLFMETFESIRTHFRELFRKLFGGGEADIVLEDPNDVLECGIDIVARPPGKELRSITLLSGGEKTLTAVALLFAMFKSKPSPYCILDEVDAALDEANVERYAAILGEFVHMTQFIVITHRKRTMTAADVIYGVTMEQAGVSKRMAVRFEEVGETGEIQTRGGRAA